MGRSKSGPYRKKGRKYFQATVGGKLRRYDVETLKDARRAWKNDVAATANNRPLPAPVDGYTLDNIFQAFLDHVEASGKSPRTYRGHKQRLKSLVKQAQVGDTLPASQLKPSDLTIWFQKTGWGVTTQGRAIESVKAALNWAVREGHLTANPVSHYRKPPALRREFLWTRRQLAAILCAMPRWLARWTLFLWYTGCRPDEATRALGTHVGKRGDTIEVLKSKTGRARAVVVPGRFRQRVARWAKAAGDSPLFTTEYGAPVSESARKKPWAAARTAAKFGNGETANLPREAIPYAFRHTWIHRALTDGHLSLVEVSQLTGTSLLMLQRVYGHLDRAPINRIADRLASL